MHSTTILHTCSQEDNRKLMCELIHFMIIPILIILFAYFVIRQGVGFYSLQYYPKRNGYGRTTKDK